MRSKLFQFLGLGVLSAVNLLAGPVAWAAPVTSFSTQPVTDAGAVTDDPNLVGKILNLMNVNVGGNDWTNSALRIQLTTGQIYNATNAAGTDASPNANLWTIPTLRNGKYDTFVNSKGSGANPDDSPTSATLLGTLNADGSPGPLPALGLANNGATLLSAQWGNLVGGETGTFSVGRFTLSADAVGTFIGLTQDSGSGGVVTTFSGNIVGGVMTVPEPAALGLVGVACAGGLVRRRRQAW